MRQWTFYADGPNGQRRTDIVAYGATYEDAFRPWAAGGWYWWRVFSERGDLIVWR